MSARSHFRLALALAAVAILAAALGAFVAREQARAAGGANCFGKRATIVSAAKRIVGTKRPDTIVVKGSGDHTILGNGGNDRICGGPGNEEIDGGRGVDRVSGGDGNDSIRGYKGADKLGGGPGDDAVIGEQGSDQISGGPGNDRLLGEKGNDSLAGDDGDDNLDGGAGDDARLDGGGGVDFVSGGSGIDGADGGPGDGDVVRGDGGPDTLSGGAGNLDIVSFASATASGVAVNLAAAVADGDGNDKLSGFEDVVGSPQADTLTGDAGPNRIDGGVGDDTLVSGGGGGEAFGGPGTDKCSGFAVENSCGPERASPADAAFVTLNRGLDGSSLIVQGGPGPDRVRIAGAGESWTLASEGRVVAGDGCAVTNGGVACSGGSVALIVATGGAGDDAIAIDPGVPGSVTVRLNGNAGSDNLVGGAGDDVLEAGETYANPDNGNDVLDGNDGSDALFADPGADTIRGGRGNDLMVSSSQLCQGHSYDGGPGQDTVSWARSDGPGVHATLKGSGGPAGCRKLDRIAAAEGLEGSNGPDVLIGDARNNGFLGHTGADTMIGKGGNDYIDATDGQRDKRIDCGPGGYDEAVVDRRDPRAISC